MLILFFNLKKQNGGNHWLNRFLLASWGIKIEGTMIYIYFFFQSKEAKSRKPRHILFLFFWIQGFKTEETICYPKPFLESKETKPKKQWNLQIPFLSKTIEPRNQWVVHFPSFNLRKQNGANHWLFTFFCLYKTQGNYRLYTFLSSR